MSCHVTRYIYTEKDITSINTMLALALTVSSSYNATNICIHACTHARVCVCAIDTYSYPSLACSYIPFTELYRVYIILMCMQVKGAGKILCL